MANYGFSTTVPYGTDLFEVTGTEYLEWQEALEGCDEGDTNAMDWVTYDFLIRNGYFVKAPAIERPKSEAEGEDKGKVKLETEFERRLRLGAEGGSVGFRESQGERVISGEAREPAWTPSKILSERDKLLRERERAAKLKEEALQARIRDQQWREWNKRQNQTIDIRWYNPDGTEYTIGDWLKIILVAGIILSFIIVVLK